MTETPDDGEHESSEMHTMTSSLSSISSCCTSHSRSSTVQGGNALSSLLSQPGAGQFSSFGNPLAEAAAADAAAATTPQSAGAAGAPTSTVSSWPGGLSDSSGMAAGPPGGGGRGVRAVAGMPPVGLPGMALEHHGVVEDSGLVHQESDGAWRVQWRPLSAAVPSQPPRHVPRPGVVAPAAVQQRAARPKLARPVQCAALLLV